MSSTKACELTNNNDVPMKLNGKTPNDDVDEQVEKEIDELFKLTKEKVKKLKDTQRGVPTKQPPKPRVLIIQNDVLCPPATAIASLVARKIPYQLVFGFYAHTFLQIHPLMYEAIIILGGRSGVYERHEKKWLAAEIKFIRLAVNEQIPVLGICLGSQVLAHAVGGTVMPGQNGIEIDYDDWNYVKYDIENVGYTDDPFLYVLKQKHLNKFVVLFHGDTFALPNACKITNCNGVSKYLDVELLARTSKKGYNCLFRVGNYSYGFQGHPELTFDLVNIWCRAWDSSFLKKSTIRHLKNVIAYAKKHQDQIVISSKILFDVWIDFALVHDNVKSKSSEMFVPGILLKEETDSKQSSKERLAKRRNTKNFDKFLLNKYNDLNIWEAEQVDADVDAVNKIDDEGKEQENDKQFWDQMDPEAQQNINELVNVIQPTKGNLGQTMSYNQVNMITKSVTSPNPEDEHSAKAFKYNNTKKANKKNNKKSKKSISKKGTKPKRKLTASKEHSYTPTGAKSKISHSSHNPGAISASGKKKDDLNSNLNLFKLNTIRDPSAFENEDSESDASDELEEAEMLNVLGNANN